VICYEKSSRNPQLIVLQFSKFVQFENPLANSTLVTTLKPGTDDGILGTEARPVMATDEYE